MPPSLAPVSSAIRFSSRGSLTFSRKTAGIFCFLIWVMILATSLAEASESVEQPARKAFRGRPAAEQDGQEILVGAGLGAVALEAQGLAGDGLTVDADGRWSGGWHAADGSRMPLTGRLPAAYRRRVRPAG